MVFWEFWGWRCENTVFSPPKGTTCMNTRLLVYRVSKSVQRVELYRWVEKFCVQRNKKVSGKFGCIRRSNPWGDFDQMWRVGRYGRRNHVCNIWWLSVKGSGCGERGNFAFSNWLKVSPFQHWSHYRVTVWFQEHAVIRLISVKVLLLQNNNRYRHFVVWIVASPLTLSDLWRLFQIL